MKKNEVSRRDFSQTYWTGFGSLAFSSFFWLILALGQVVIFFRVATYSVSVYKEPNDKKSYPLPTIPG